MLQNEPGNNWKIQLGKERRGRLKENKVAWKKEKKKSELIGNTNDRTKQRNMITKANWYIT